MSLLPADCQILGRGSVGDYCTSSPYTQSTDCKYGSFCNPESSKCEKSDSSRDNKLWIYVSIGSSIGVLVLLLLFTI